MSKKEFEDWAKSFAAESLELNLKKNTQGVYFSTTTHKAYRAFQAGKLHLDPLEKTSEH